MAQDLRIIIGAETKDLEKAIQRAKKDLNQFERQAIKGSGGVNKFGKSVANAQPTLQEFSRVIQDAPFGIQGVGNNITQLASVFGNLTRSAGGTKAALKAVLGSFLGPGGLIFLISSAVSLLTVFGDELFRSKNSVKALREEQDKLKQSLEDYVFQLDASNKARLKGEQNAQKELRTLRDLRKQAENTALSQRQRLAAVNELQKKYPNYLGNINQEKILNGGLTDTYNKLTTSILKRAKASAATNQIIKNSETLLTLESKQAAAKSNLIALEAQLAQKLAEVNTRRKRGAGGISSINKEIANTKEEIQSLEGLIQGLELSNINLNQLIFDNVVVDPKPFEDGISRAITQAVNELNLSSGTIQPAQITTGGFGEQLITIEDQLRDFNDRISDIINNNIANTFAGLAEAIGGALVSGANLGQALGSVLLSTIGNVAVQLGQLAIGTGVAIEAVKTALTSLNGIGAIAAGVALVAIGSAFKAGARNLASAGGNVGGAGSISGGSAINTSFGGGGFNGGRVVFRIAGRDLIGVLNNEAAAQARIGDSSGLIPG